MFNYNKIDEYQIELTTYCNAACPQCPRNINGGTLNGTSVSRTNGYDITNNEGIQKIVQESLKHNVFINNAFDGAPHEDWANFAQTNLYMAVYDAWKSANKSGVIINIGSVGENQSWHLNQDLKRIVLAKLHFLMPANREVNHLNKIK
jgi:hypothetical protein